MHIDLANSSCLHAKAVGFSPSPLAKRGNFGLSGMGGGTMGSV